VVSDTIALDEPFEDRLLLRFGNARSFVTDAYDDPIRPFFNADEHVR